MINGLSDPGVNGPAVSTGGVPMKPLISLWFGFLLVIVAIAPASHAQVPRVAIYADEALQDRYINGCPEEPPGSVADTLYVVAEGFDMAMTSIEYRIDLGPHLFFLGDIVPDGVVEGDYSGDGIRITFPTPADATGRLLVHMIVFCYNCWRCDDINGITILDALITVLPHPESGKIQAIRWPDMTAVEAEGMPLILCQRASIPVEQTTWGMIKALYH
jgi:hypothetical protein